MHMTPASFLGRFALLIGLSLLAACDADKPADSGSFEQDGDGDGYDASQDCDDAAADVNPGAAEICNGLDDDCDGFVDDEDPNVTGTGSWYADADGDGFGDADSELAACDQPSGYVADDSDCDDSLDSVNPEAAELCDGLDNDCDGLIDGDDDDAQGDATWYADVDGDGYGDASAGVQSCSCPKGYVADDGDCDDGDADVHPDAEEHCDGQDEDCDGSIDEEAIDALAWYADSDGDGYGDEAHSIQSCEQPKGYLENSSDCDDGDAAIHPDATEICNELDDDCDGLVDDEDADLSGGETWYADADSDGFGDGDVSAEACLQPSGYEAEAGDCDDTQAAINPDAQEICDGLDNDCDDLTDDDDTVADASTWYADTDGDGFGNASSSARACEHPSGHVSDDTDCDDTDGAINPDAQEICDGLDNDCDGLTDDEDAVTDASTWYADTDGDGFGDAASSVQACDQPTGHVADDTDCDDSDAQVNPEGSEICDRQDNDCDGLTDDEDGDVTGGSAWYADTDGDGFGDAGTSAEACSAPSGYVAVDTDCDDGDAAINPDAQETCDGVDEDCDHEIDEEASDASTWYADSDGDGFGDAASSVQACDQPTDHVSDGTDCDDGDAAVNPDASEICDGLDNDCDSLVDDDDGDVTGGSAWYLDSDGDGFGDAGSTAEACSAPSGYVADDADCDDSDAAINPNAQETCDGADEDCDGEIDEDAVDASTWYVDADGDGYGDEDSATIDCSQPSGTIATGGDCDDTDAAINPGATEHCDLTDNDCDGTLDPASTVSFVDSFGNISDVSSNFTSGKAATYSFSSNGTLYFCPGSYTGLISVSAAAASIVGTEGAALTELSAELNGSVISAATGAAILEIEGMTLSWGYGSKGGGVYSLVSGMDLTLTDCVITDSLSPEGGGLYFEAGGTLALDGVEVTACEADKGGALYLKTSSAELTDCDFHDNQTYGSHGGGIYVKDAYLTATGLELSDNVALDKGGGAYTACCLFDLEESLVDGNIASSSGGGLYLKDVGAPYFLETLVTGNQSSSTGGGLYLDKGALTCSGTSSTSAGFTDNTASSGAGIYLKGGTAVLTSDVCDWGTRAASDDNSPDDVDGDHMSAAYSSYGDDESFSCDHSSCW